MASDVLRSEEVIALYKVKRRDPEFHLDEFDLRDLPIVKKWKLWILVQNEFPYDKIADNHCLLVPLRQFAEDEDMYGTERSELFRIKEEFKQTKDFDAVFENVKHNRTVPDVYHLHALKFKFRTPVSEL